MPYGCLAGKTLSAASRKALEGALEHWQKSMQISRPKTFLLLASYEEGSGPELELKRDLVSSAVADEGLCNNVIAITAKNEEELATKVARNKTLMPIQTLILFAESRHALALRPIFKRKFGRALEIRKFKADFEFHHPWISTSSSIVWFFRNLLLGVWVGIRKRSGRSLRKKFKLFFWS